jgi:hypothetical protein
MSQHELMPAITFMERKVDEAERKVNELLGALNVLRAEAGMPPRPGGGGSGGSDVSGSIPTQIKPDSFLGKKQQTAIREFLEIRRAQGLGPAKPREIYDALHAGGYQFEAKTADIALVGLRALLRKRSETFYQLNNGTYGLVAWYPDLKRPKSSASSGEDADDDSDNDQEEEKETTADPKVAAAS